MEGSNLSYVPKAVIRKPAPEFSGAVWQGDAIKKVSLSDYRGKWVVLFFYPLDFTFVCPTEICNFSDSYDTFQAMSRFYNSIIKLNFSMKIRNCIKFYFNIFEYRIF